MNEARPRSGGRGRFRWMGGTKKTCRLTFQLKAGGGVKILLVAPDGLGVDAVSEVRRVQQFHDVASLYGTVTPDDIYRAMQEKSFDVLHFATHGGPDGVLLSNGVLLDAETIAQLARLRETAGVFFSACQTGRLASYCVRHGTRWAISSEVDLSDADAWKLAAAFYSHQRNGNAKDFVGAFRLADDGDGDYALHISLDWIADLQRAAAAAATIPHTATLTRQEAALWAGGTLGATAALILLILRLAGVL